MSVAGQFNTSDSDLGDRSPREATDARIDFPFSKSGAATNLPFIAAIVSSLVFGALLLVIVSQSWASAPYWDQWGYEADPLIRHFSHTLTLGELLSQHNESRLFVARIVTLLYAPLTGWDVRFEVVLSVLAVLLVSIGIHILILRNAILTAEQKTVCIVLASGIILQTTQWEVLLFGAYYFVIPGLATVWSLVVAGNRWRFPVKVLAWSALSLFATLSYINGVILWALLLPCLVLESGRSAGSKTSNRSWAVLYPVLGAMTLFLYFGGYKHPRASPTTKATFAEPSRIAKYFFYWIGAPFAHFSLPLSFYACCGAALLLLFVAPVAVYLLATDRRRYGVHNFYGFLTIGAYALITGLSVTVGRSGFGEAQAFSSRYHTFSLLLPAILFPLLFVLAELVSNRHPSRRGQWNHAITLIAGAVGMLFVMSFVNGVVDLRTYGNARHKAELVVAYSTVIPDNPGIALADPYPADVVRVCRILAPFHLPHVTRGADRVIAAAKRVSLLGDPSNGFLDAVADTPDSLVISGWAILKKRQKPADAVLIEWSGVDGKVKPIAILAVGTLREDVASVYGNNDLSASGFSEIISKANIPGPGVISAWAVNEKTHMAYELATTRHIGTPPGS